MSFNNCMQQTNIFYKLSDFLMIPYGTQIRIHFLWCKATKTHLGSCFALSQWNHVMLVYWWRVRLTSWHAPDGNRGLSFYPINPCNGFQGRRPPQMAGQPPPPLFSLRMRSPGIAKRDSLVITV